MATMNVDMIGSESYAQASDDGTADVGGWPFWHDRALSHMNDYVSGTRAGAIFFVIAESGMGKSTLAERFAYSQVAKGMETRLVSYADKTSDAAKTALVRLARTEIGRSRDEGTRSVIIIDDMPASDECDLNRQATSLRKLKGIGDYVVVCMHPEAIQLAEDMPDTHQLHITDLAMPSYFLETDEAGADLTAGIPALYQAVLKDRATSRGPLSSGSFYLAALQRLVTSYLRDSVLAEEIELRLAMILLGKGTTDELSACLERLDTEMMLCHRDEAPLFCIDNLLDSFCCVGLEHDCVLAAVIASLGTQYADASDIAFGVANILAEREEYHRSSLVATICTVEQRLRLCARWGVEYVCAGELSFVRGSHMSVGQADAGSREGVEVAYAALSLVERGQGEFREDRLAHLAGPLRAEVAFLADADEGRRRRHGSLLRACRDLDSGIVRDGGAAGPAEDDELSCALASHLEARMLIMEGSFSESYRLLVNNPQRLSGDSVASALLCDDFALASMLSGSGPEEEDARTFELSRVFLCGLGVHRLTTYRGVLEQWLTAMVGRREKIDGVESAISCASRMGDAALQAALLLGAAVCDLRTRRLPRAHVRALQAYELMASRQSYLAQAALFVDGLVHLCLGDGHILERFASKDAQTPMNFHSRVLLACLDEEGRESALSLVGDRAYDPDATWVLNLLCNDLGELSSLYRSVIPEAWLNTLRHSVRRADAFSHSTDQSDLRDVERRVRRAPQGGTAASGRPLRVSLLGDFRVAFRGEPLEIQCLGRRRAGSLIACLAACEGHRMTRVELIETLWPECGYHEAQKKLYEATSRARIMLRAAELDTDPFVAHRGEGWLGLNMACVSVDVDEFADKARRALAEHDAARTIDLACDALALYCGDLQVSAFDACGVQAARRDELRDLFVDVAIVAARAAISDGKFSLATRLARSAHEASAFREDAVLCLIDALRATGRSQLAREVYQNFTKQLLERTGMPPTVGLRRAVEGLFPRTRSQRKVHRPRPGELATVER